ncbi:hypothetical protein H257_15724 [Aphanomyces astaci]|uniref:FCP1 homology domain-containing protein n=1 Tax=Aphanomyces astaci TaxID=112090 RepID=W4FLB1_APHAT|nr:hypothetical protein H257_15724 [Aphanomyces astaci]ETV68275.1 hypothetical protein H257_15724 [Aphanomyces astaci]|eukprot:XP_009842218.1 hypothetical protein H257_15724 [Aphanomyces astaci]
MASSVDVVVGATFAVDDIHAAMQLLFRETLPSITASLTWIPYGQTASFLAQPTQLAASSPTRHAVTLVFVRLVDLWHSHPELRQEAPDMSLMHRFCAAIDTHIALNPSRHIVLVLCPSPPELVDDNAYIANEHAFLAQLPRKVVTVTNVFACYDPPSPYYDVVADTLSHSPYTTAMAHLLALVGTRSICRVFRTITKVIVVDCDHTLWTGAVSEDGLDGIAIPPAYAALQRFLVAQFTKGVLLCVCSRNVPKDVHAVFANHPDMVLQWDVHILLAKINHELKSANIQALVTQLNVAMDSVVFVDDNAVECGDVEQNCPGISVVQVPMQLTPEFMPTCWAFDSPLGTFDATVTAEDARRTAMYRHQLLACAITNHPSTLSQIPSIVSGTPDTLKLSLGMQIDIQLVDSSATVSSTLSRLVQLCQRTNQFNCHTDAARAFTSDAHVVAFRGSILYVHVTDRFGHYGLVGMAAWTELDDETSRIDVFVLSCRVLNRGIEHAMLQYVATHTTSTTIHIAFVSTVRNVPAATFVANLPHVTKTKHGYAVPRASVLALHNQPVVTTSTTNHANLTTGGRPRGLPTTNFPTLAALSSFIESFSSAPSTVQGGVDVVQVTTPVASQDVDIADACKFRRQQREALKKLQKEATGTAIPIWTTNNVSERKPCPQCKVHTLALTSKCTFERCRSCCYNIQKWLQRAHDHPHPKARHVALDLLQQANIDILRSQRGCNVHTNQRRANDF